MQVLDNRIPGDGLVYRDRSNPDESTDKAATEMFQRIIFKISEFAYSVCPRGVRGGGPLFYTSKQSCWRVDWQVS